MSVTQSPTGLTGQFEGYGNFTIHGTTTDAPSGTRVEAWVRGPGVPSFQLRRAAMTQPNGTWSVALPVTTAGTWSFRARVGGRWWSSVQTTCVTPVSITLASHSASTLSSAPVTGMSNLRAARPAVLQVSSHGYWTQPSTASASAAGVLSATAPGAPGSIGAWTVRFGLLLPNTGHWVYSRAVTSARVMPPADYRFTEAQGRLIAARNGIAVKSSGGCSSRLSSACTALATMRSSTLAVAVQIRRDGIPVTISGGTEVGHAPGVYTHHAGYKIDLLMSPALTHWVHAHASRSGGLYFRYSQGYTMVFFDEASHWDVTVKPTFPSNARA